jgi:hypothetical protein
VWHEVKARLDQTGTTTIPVSVEAAEPGDVVADVTEPGDGERVAEADAAGAEAAGAGAAGADAEPHETPASSPGAP